jgi:hypothetical protein
MLYEGFSLSHASILDAPSTTGGTGFGNTGTGTEINSGAQGMTMYGCRNGTLATDSGNFENTGDDIVQSEWFWFNFANVTIENGFIPFPTLSTITGTVVQSSGVSPNDYYALPLWTLSSLNVQTRPMAIRVPSKDSAGAIRTLDFLLYRVQFQPFNFTGPSYKNGMTCSIAGRALLSLFNEVGLALPASFPRSIGRMISSPGVLTGAFVQEPFGANF